jgi:two-component system cell cycle sensor histidine kinase/response regulator CckA
MIGFNQIELFDHTGTTFRVSFPAVEASVLDSEGSEPDPDDAWRPEGTILFVDDEPAVRSLVCRILEGAGVTVMTAVDGNDALLWSA